MQAFIKYLFLLIFFVHMLFSSSCIVYSAAEKLDYYNDPPGKQEFNIFGIKKKREITSIGVISPDKTMMAFSVAYFYPSISQLTSKVFVVQSPFRIAITDKISKSILETGTNSIDKQIFRCFTIVDWSYDSKKILIKEVVGENQEGIWATNLWVYNFDTSSSQRLDDINKAIAYYWKTKQKVDLADFRWDIVPRGWDINNPDMVIVNAYGYGNSGKQFLGCWGIDTYKNSMSLISFTNQAIPVAKNGFKFIPKK